MKERTESNTDPKREGKKNKVGAPKKWTGQTLAELISALDSYIDSKEIPVLKEFCYQNRVNSTYIYEIPELQESIKRLHDKKESNVEILGREGKINPTMAIFTLKQLGWKDRFEHTGADGKTLFDGLIYKEHNATKA